MAAGSIVSIQMEVWAHLKLLQGLLDKDGRDLAKSSSLFIHKKK